MPPALHSETMKRIAESFFVGKPHVEKYLLQLCALPPSPVTKKKKAGGGKKKK